MAPQLDRTGAAVSFSGREARYAASRIRAATVFAICFAASFFEGFDHLAIAVAAPQMAPDRKLNHATLGIIFTLASVGQLIGTSIGGRLADQLGRKPVFLVAMLLCGLFTLATPLASGPILLGATRLLAGTALGASMPALLAIAADTSSPQRRLSNASLIFAGLPLGGVMVSLIGAYTTIGANWQNIFYLGGAATLALVPLIALFVVETRVPIRKNAAQPAASIRDALFGENRATASILLWLLLVPTAMILHLLLSWLPLLMIERGFDATGASKVLLSFSIGAFVGGVAIGKLVDFFGMRVVLPTAFALLVGTAAAVSQTSNLGALNLLSAALGVVVGAVQMANYGVVGVFYPARVRGTGAGIALAVSRIGTILGPFSAGLMLSGGVSATHILLALAGTAIIPGAAIFALSFLRPADDRATAS